MSRQPSPLQTNSDHTITRCQDPDRHNRTGQALRLGSDRNGWTGYLALGPYWLLYAGAVGPTAEHRHHAVQVIAATNRVTVTIGSEPITAGLILVPADTPHQIIEGTSNATVLFVDADALATTLPAPPASLSEPIADPEQVTHTDALRVADEMLSSIGAPTASRPKLSDQVETAIQLLDRDLGATAAHAATRVGLSPGELSRRFSREVGIPFRSYRRWRRLLLAVEALAQGANLTDAAHSAGFSDSAHLTRTFRAMFGIAPSELTGSSQWLHSRSRTFVQAPPSGGGAR